MNHPQNRSERRFIRELYITKRKKQQLRNWYFRTYSEIPHEGQENQFIGYIKYLHWIALSDDEKTILQVEAILDGVKLEEPWWKPTFWSRYAKNSSLCSCHSCKKHSWGEKSEKRKRRELLNKKVEEGLQDAEESICSLVG